MSLDDELGRTREAAVAYADDGEELTGVVPAEPGAAGRVYLCVFRSGERRSWLALDADGMPVLDRERVHDAVSIAALCELAEESAGGGDLPALRGRLAELREKERPEGIEEAEAAAAELERMIATPPRIASPAYLDSIGLAASRLERALGEVGSSPFAAAMHSGLSVADELAADVERTYKRPLRGGPEGD